MPRTHRTVACVVVRSAKTFAWLGHMPIINWALKQLMDVRGIDAVVCVAEARLVERARKLLRKEAIEVIAIPSAMTAQKSERDFDKWLVSATGPANTADVVLVVRPTSPFMPTAKIEAVLNNVVSKIADTSGTARELDAYVRQPAGLAVGRYPVFADVTTCRAFAPGRMAERGVGKYQHVPLDLIESLDVSVPDNLRVATALVTTGKI